MVFARLDTTFSISSAVFPWYIYYISIHEGCDFASLSSLSVWLIFQSTQPRRLQLSQIVFITCLKNISNHTPTRDVTYDTIPNTAPTMISILAPMRGATEIDCLKTQKAKRISIHTPTRVATPYYGLEKSFFYQFQSTKDVTYFFVAPTIYVKYFNPHVHAGCDFSPWEIWSTGRISIHTPAQVATIKYGVAFFRINISIHTATQDVPPFFLDLIKLLRFVGFNPRTHAGYNDSIWTILTMQSYFNPRTHAGYNPPYFIWFLHSKTFQFTHLHRMRPSISARLFHI